MNNMDNNQILYKTLEKEKKLIINNYHQLEEKYSQLEEEYIKEKKLNEDILKEKNSIQEQLDSILYSRSYKAIQKIKKILGR